MESRGGAEKVQDLGAPSTGVLSKNLIYTTAVTCLGVLVLGCGLGYTSPALLELNSHPNPFHLNYDEVSWVGSVLTVGCCFGNAIAGFLADRVGRQYILVLGIAPFVLSWVLVAASHNLAMLMTGRFLCGFWASWEMLTVAVYLTEVAPSALRGRVQACMALANNAGVLIIYVCGSLLPWNWLAIVPAVILSVTMLMLLHTPETPRWLLINGYRGGAREALQWLRGDRDVEHELAEIAVSLSQQNPKLTGLRELTAKGIYKPLLICTAIWIFQVFSGVDYVLFYTVAILSSTAAFLNPYHQTILVGCTGLVGNLISFFFIDKLGRRICLMASGVAMMLCLVLLGFFYRYQHTALSQLTWLPLACLMTFQLSYSFGWGPVPSIITGELLPTRARGVGTGIATFVLSIVMFLETKFGIIIANSWIHQYGLFWMFAVILFCGIVFVALFLPETKGMTLEEIEAGFENTSAETGVSTADRCC